MPPTETVSGTAFSNVSSESTIRRKVVIVTHGKTMNKFSVRQISSEVVSNQKEIQAVDRENADDACTCNLRSIIIHRTDVDNEKGT